MVIMWTLQFLSNHYFTLKPLHDDFILLLHKCWPLNRKISFLNFGQDERCNICNLDSQTHLHVLSECPPIQICLGWAIKEKNLPANVRRYDSLEDLLCLKYVLSPLEVNYRFFILHTIKSTIIIHRSGFSNFVSLFKEVFKSTFPSSLSP